MVLLVVVLGGAGLPGAGVVAGGPGGNVVVVATVTGASGAGPPTVAGPLTAGPVTEGGAGWTGAEVVGVVWMAAAGRVPVSVSTTTAAPTPIHRLVAATTLTIGASCS
jgi:hypothetical protein